MSIKTERKQGDSMEKFTVTQRERLAELDAAPDILDMEFDTTEARCV